VGPTVPSRYDPQETEHTIKQLTHIANSGASDDDFHPPITMRELRVLLAAMQDEIELRAGFVARAREAEDRLDRIGFDAELTARKAVSDLETCRALLKGCRQGGADLRKRLRAIHAIASYGAEGKDDYENMQDIIKLATLSRTSRASAATSPDAAREPGPAQP
jgi:hypothetical protein